MSCHSFQDAISARIDGEDPGLSDDVLDAHIETCAPCQAYRAQAVALHRHVRVRSAEPVPDLSGAILGALPRIEPTPAPRPVALTARSARPREWARYLLLTVAVTQLLIALPAIVLGDEAGASVHLARELGSWDVALAIAWLVVAWAPRRAAGLLPFAAALAAVMIGTAGLDVASGRAQLLGETHHILDIAGLVALWALARCDATFGPLLPLPHRHGPRRVAPVPPS